MAQYGVSKRVTRQDAIQPIHRSDVDVGIGGNHDREATRLHRSPITLAQGYVKYDDGAIVE